jgi:hypothetical protein
MKAQSVNDEPLVSLYFNPTNVGSNDIGALYFTLTDSVDPTISLRIKIGVTKEKKTCLTAGGQNQVLTGLEGESLYHRDDGFGTYVYTSLYSFDHNRTISMPNYSVMRINYDVRDNTVKAIDSAGEAWGSGYRTVADLDSKTFFPTTLWDGFPSGQVRLSMHATDWASPSTQICITNLYGQDNLQEFMESEIEDNEAPDITVNLDVIGFVDPKATVNIIKDCLLVEKKCIDVPERLVDVIKCKNPRCITSVEQGIDHIFKLTDSGVYRCIYCESSINK